jgi:hypothetical protein
MEAIMLVRMRVTVLLILLFASLAVAGNKKKIVLPAYVLKARTVIVLIDPDAGINPQAPLANKTAQEEVEKAIAKWGRLSLVLDPQTADLVITIRKGSGKLVQQTIGGMPTNDRPVIVQPNDTGIRIGAQQGRLPSAPTQPQPQDTRPSPQTEVGNSEDTFIVYEGHSEGRSSGSLDQQAPAWRYSNKNALHSPNVPAVDEFRKLIEEAEKQQKTKP